MTTTTAPLSHCPEILMSTPFQRLNHSFAPNPRQRTIVVDASGSQCSNQTLAPLPRSALSATGSLEKNGSFTARNTPFSIRLYRRPHALILILRGSYRWRLPYLPLPAPYSGS